ncbi:MAG: phytoene desaturase family protein [Acidimicrobiales bacterium]
MIDAVVVGSGPNGLSAAITLARAGASVTVLEAQDLPGGGARSAELTLPGFLHDVCSAVHPLAVSSPAFASWPLADHGLKWLHPDYPLVHPLGGGDAVVLHRSLAETADGLGRDGQAWHRLMGPLVRDWDPLSEAILAPMLKIPSHPLALARFGARSAWPATVLARTMFRNEGTRAAFAGLAGHSFCDLTDPLTSAFSLLLGVTAHAVGWPLAQGGSQALTRALISYLESLGGEVHTGVNITDHHQLPRHRVALFDLTPRQLVNIGGSQMAPSHLTRLKRYRYGPGTFKMDFALDGPVPWSAAAAHRAGTLHLGATLDEIARAESDVAAGRHPRSPLVLCVQPTVVDPGRAPEGRHILWAYCHVPHGSNQDMAPVIEAQIERFAPGFGARVLARHSVGPAALEAGNANYIGGDIAGGAAGGWQLFARPVLATDPYRVPTQSGPAWFMCSASTPPGAGVHGMCGWWAAQGALRSLGRTKGPG